VHHHTIQINQPTRCKNFWSFLLEVYVQLNKFRTWGRHETCWAVHKRQVINWRNCCIWLVDLFESRVLVVKGVATLLTLFCSEEQQAGFSETSVR